MDDTFEVDLEKEEIEFFEKVRYDSCYIYLPSSKIDNNGLRIPKSKSEFYEFDEVDACIENLDVDELKDSPKLKREIKTILSRFGVREDILQEEIWINKLLSLPYHRVCRVDLLERPAMRMMDPGFNFAELPKIKEEWENRKPDKVVLRQDVIRLLEEYTIYDRSNDAIRKGITEGIRSNPRPEILLKILIDDHRSAVVYKRIREQIIAKYSPDERWGFGFNLSIISFFEEIERICYETVCERYWKAMSPYRTLDNIMNSVKKMDEDPSVCAEELFTSGSGLLKVLRHYNEGYTQEQQVVLQIYPWIKRYFQSLRKLINRDVFLPKPLEKMPSLQEVFDMKDGGLQLMKSLISTFPEVIEACIEYDNKNGLRNQENAAPQSPTPVIHNYNGITVKIPRKVNFRDKNKAVSLVRKLNMLGENVEKPRSPWRLTKNNQDIMEKYKNAECVLLAKSYVEKGWMVYDCTDTSSKH